MAVQKEREEGEKGEEGEGEEEATWFPSPNWELLTRNEGAS